MPRVVDHEQRRYEIATAVWAVIATKGPLAVTMRSVAETASVSVGRIQHYFANKDQMLEYGLTAMIEGATEALHRPEGSSPRDALRRLLTHALPATPQRRVGTMVWYAYLGMAISHPRIGEILRESKAVADDRAADLVAILSGRERDACTDIGRALVALADGLAQRILVGSVTAREATTLLEAAMDRAERPRGVAGESEAGEPAPRRDPVPRSP